MSISSISSAVSSVTGTTAGGAAVTSPIGDNQFWTRLVSTRDSTRKVVFNTMPIVAESGPVNYSVQNPTHMPGSYYVYENTPSRTFELSEIKLVSRNPLEARANLVTLNMLRSWRYSYFGAIQALSGTGATNDVTSLAGGVIDESQAKEMRDFSGAPPEVLYLSAYSTAQQRGNISNIPTVLLGLNINYPNDIDYIATATTGAGDVLGGVPFPIIMTISVNLAEQHSSDEYESFNLAQYRAGKLINF